MFPQNRVLLQVPFYYLAMTRMNSLKGLVSNASSAWLPGVLVVTFLSDYSFLEAALHYVFTYLAFVSIYEVGYLVNDTLGTKHDETPRHRLKMKLASFEILIFVLIRVAALVVIAHLYDLFSNPAWSVSVLALVVVIVMHNTIASSALKAASFLQMSMLRFSLPIIPHVGNDAVPAVLLLAIFHFVYPRFITYLDSKERLKIPERKTSRYGAQVQLLLLPTFFLLSVLMNHALPLVIWLYYLLFQFLRFLIERRRGLST